MSSRLPNAGASTGSAHRRAFVSQDKTPPRAGSLRLSPPEFPVRVLQEDTSLAQNRLFHFLSYVDGALQEHTLGVTREHRQEPSISSHHFRNLQDYQFAVKEKGDATGDATLPDSCLPWAQKKTWLTWKKTWLTCCFTCMVAKNPLCIHLPAYQVEPRVVQHKHEGKKGFRRTAFLVTRPKPNSYTAIFPGPLCLQQFEYQGRQPGHSWWPTTALEKSIEGKQDFTLTSDQIFPREGKTSSLGLGGPLDAKSDHASRLCPSSLCDEDSAARCCGISIPWSEQNAKWHQLQHGHLEAGNHASFKE